MNWQTLCHTIEHADGIIIHTAAIVMPMEGCETLSTQQTGVRLPDEKERWCLAKVFYDNKKKEFKITFKRVSFVFKKFSAESVWCHDDRGTLVPINEKSSGFIDCMIEQYRNNLRYGTRTLQK
jgi:hypothetical protein